MAKVITTLRKAADAIGETAIGSSKAADEDVPPSRGLSLTFSFAFRKQQDVAYADKLHQTLREGDIVLFMGKQARTATRRPHPVDTLHSAHVRLTALGARQVHDKVIRCCTGSEFNHVAMVVKNLDGELELFEATALGVGRVPLEFYINSYYWSHMSALFHKVVVRHLHTGRGRGITRAMRADLMRYQDEMLGERFAMC